MSDKCTAQVFDSSTARRHPCSNWAQPGTMFCGIHSPEAEAKRKAKSEAKWAKDSAARDARNVAFNEARRKEQAYPVLLNLVRSFMAQGVRKGECKRILTQIGEPDE